MTQVQLDEYMRQVKWKTMIYFGFLSASSLLAGSGMYYGIKQDIRESTYVGTVHYLNLNHKMDSLHYVDQHDIQSLRDDIKLLK